MKNFVFFNDEEQTATSIYENGFTNNEFNGYEAERVAKYFRNIMGYKDTRTRNALIEFSYKYDPNFNDVLFRESIILAVRNSKKYPDWSDKTSPISVTSAEMATVRSVRDATFQKLMLTFLIFAKRDNGYVYFQKWEPIRRIIRMNLSYADMYGYLHRAYKKKMLRDSNDNILIKFINNESDPVITVSTDTDVLNLMDLFLRFTGGDFAYCEDCGAEFLKEGKRNRFCDIHKRERLNRTKRQYRKTSRDK